LMFERFTDRARRVVVLAQLEARRLEHSHIGTEHLLLGLIAEEDGVAARVLADLGIGLETARQQVIGIIGEGPGPAESHIPFTPRAKKVMELSLREALALGHNDIGTEHILLGLLREGDGVGAQVLVASGADLVTVREKVVELLGTIPVVKTRRSRRGAVATVAAMTAGSTDEIRLTGIRVRAHHGVYLEEQEQGQDFVVDLVAHLDLTAAGESDRLEDTVDYGDLAQRVHDLVATERWNLLERVAERVARLVFDDERVREVEVTVHKPQAPIAVPFDDVSVTIRRWR
jgi:dihydroneopterin aldolase